MITSRTKEAKNHVEFVSTHVMSYESDTVHIYEETAETKTKLVSITFKDDGMVDIIFYNNELGVTGFLHKEWAGKPSTGITLERLP